MLQITRTQMAIFSHQMSERTVLDLVQALDNHFLDENIRPAVNWRKLTSEDQVRLVDQIAKIGIKNGFKLRGELYALAEACITVGPRELLEDVVLEHPGLTPLEKVSVMLDLYNECHLSFWGAK